MKRLILLFALAGCAHKCPEPDHPLEVPTVKSAQSVEKSETQRKILIGRWIGRVNTQNGGFQNWLIERRANGTFTIIFHLWKDAIKIHEQTESGIWGVSGGVVFMATREMLDEKGRFIPVKTTDGTYYDAYRILSLNQDSFTYQHLEEGSEFTVRRVDEKFRLE